MATTVATIGIICLLAAVAGGGLEAMGVKIPVMPTVRRQLALGGIGIVLLLASWPPVTDLLLRVRPGDIPADCGKLISENSTEKAVVVFRNLSGKTVEIYWLSYAGIPTRMSTLAPRGIYPVDTFTGHGWCFVDKATGKSMQTITIMPGMKEIPIY